MHQQLQRILIERELGEGTEGQQFAALRAKVTVLQRHYEAGRWQEAMVLANRLEAALGALRAKAVTSMLDA